jgi:glycosyltransferase involved in cell wall biosynthesis
VVAGDDNAAVELVEQGVNGFVAPSADPADIAAAIVACHAGGAELRERTADWFARRAPELTVDGSAHAVADWYGRGD